VEQNHITEAVWRGAPQDGLGSANGT
jgi:hypothetical protein